MAITYEDISALVDEGKTAAQIAAALQADPRTVKPVPLHTQTGLLYVMNFRGMLTRLVRPADGGEKWEGSIVRMILAVNEGEDATAKALVNQWFSHITNSNNDTFDTTNALFAAQLKQMATTFGDQPTMPTAEDFATVVALGGGYRYADITEAAVQTVIDNKARQDIVDACLTPIQADQAAAAAKLNNATASLESDLIEGLTKAELQTRCDAIAASEDGTVGE